MIHAVFSLRPLARSWLLSFRARRASRPRRGHGVALFGAGRHVDGLGERDGGEHAGEGAGGAVARAAYMVGAAGGFVAVRGDGVEGVAGGRGGCGVGGGGGETVAEGGAGARAETGEEAEGGSVGHFSCGMVGIWVGGWEVGR